MAADAAIGAEVLPLVYEELRRLAARRMANERPGQTLDATGLVHEAFLRLGGNQGVWNSPGHFFGAAAEAMRRILVERVRQRRSLKWGGGRRREPLADVPADATDFELLEIDDLLESLESFDPRKATLVKLRYFAGMTLDEAARALEISVSTASNDWAYARSWLRLEIEGRKSAESVGDSDLESRTGS